MLELVSEFSKIGGCKINLKKIVFLIPAISRIWIFQKIPFTIAW